MDEPTGPHHVVRFGDFEVNLREGELRKRGLKIKLQKHPLHLLAMLLEHPGKVLTREELRQTLWPSDTFVDFEHSINKAISKIRQALGDSAENPRFLETLPGYGYRFIAPVETGEPAISPSDVAAPSEATFPEVSRRSAPQRLLTKVLIAALAVVALTGLLLALKVGGWLGKFGGQATPTRIESIAVLPLENLSRNPEEDYFADGMTDELITNLAKISALRVTSRASVMHYKGGRKPLPKIAQELNVDAIVQGSVQRFGDRVRINAQLIYAPTDKHLWAESYERDLRDILALENEVARSIADEVRIRLTPQEERRFTDLRPVSPEAYEAYLKGRYHLNKGNEEEVKKSVEDFEQAYGKDPGYALAYAGLADSYLALSTYHFTPREIKPKAKAAAMKALQLDETLAEAHTALGAVSLTYDWDWPAAERELKKAIELNPSSANAHHWYAHYLTAIGRHEDAIAEIQRAHRLDPLSLDVNADEVLFLFMARKYDQAIAQGHKAIDLDPDFYLPHFFLALPLAQKGAFTEAIRELERARQLDNSPMILAVLGSVYAYAGEKRQAQAVLNQSIQIPKQHYAYICSYEIAIIYLGLGERDRAFECFQKSYRDRSDCMVWLKADPRLDGLRSGSSYRNLLRQVGMPGQ
jgi:TolB-like protein/DNA-binding winged helix-turn-helix (wHTH) protein/Tfp pilus assembly protein PilF